MNKIELSKSISHFSFLLVLFTQLLFKFAYLRVSKQQIKKNDKLSRMEK